MAGVGDFIKNKWKKFLKPHWYDEEDKFAVVWRAAAAEFFGMLIFVFLSAGGVMGVQTFRTMGGATQGFYDAGDTGFITSVALSHGFGLAVAIYAVGEVSGGHLNPAVTWAVLITGRLTILRAIVYILAQMVGAIAACGILVGVFPSGYRYAHGAHNIAADYTEARGFGSEVVYTFIFIFVVFSTAISPFVGKIAPLSGGGRDYGPGKLTPLAVGLCVLVLHLVGVPFTGPSLNPARSFGAAVINNTSSDWDVNWIYWLGPIIGATIAAVISTFLFLSDPASVKNLLISSRGQAFASGPDAVVLPEQYTEGGSQPREVTAGRDVEMQRPADKQKAKVDEEAAARQKAEEEAAARKKAEDEAAARKKAEDEAAARKKAEDEAAAKKKADEAAAAAAAAAAAKKKDDSSESKSSASSRSESGSSSSSSSKSSSQSKSSSDGGAAAAAAAAAAKKKADDEAAAKKKADEEAAARKKAEEDAARKRAEDEAARKKAEAEFAEARRKADEAEAKKKADEAAAAAAAAAAKKDDESSESSSSSSSSSSGSSSSSASSKSSASSSSASSSSAGGAAAAAAAAAAKKKADDEAAAKKKADDEAAAAREAAKKKADEEAKKKAEEDASKLKLDALSKEEVVQAKQLFNEAAAAKKKAEPTDAAPANPSASPRSAQAPVSARGHGGELDFEEVVAVLKQLLEHKMQEGNIRRLARMQFDQQDKQKRGKLNEAQFLVIYNWIKQEAEPLRLQHSKKP